MAKEYTILESERRWHVTLPIVLAQAVGIKAGDKVIWLIDRGELILKKV